MFLILNVLSALEGTLKDLFSNIFSSQASRLIEAMFHMALGPGTKIYLEGPGHLI